MIREGSGDREFRVDDTGFWQVHAAAPPTLTRAVQDAIDEALFDPRAANLDLYGGVGLLAAAVGDRSVRRRASRASSRTHAPPSTPPRTSPSGSAPSAVTARVEHWVRALADASAPSRRASQAATVVLDPPRSGAGREVLDGSRRAVARASSSTWRAIRSPSPATSGILAELGYHLTGLRAFDLFPNTHHVEAVGAFVRAMTSRQGVPRPRAMPRGTMSNGEWQIGSQDAAW